MRTARLSSFSVSIAFIFLLLFSSVSSARLSGDASLTYTSYAGHAGANRMSSNSLAQEYSLLYSTDGTIYNSRVGRYAVSLGYNWTSLDTTFKSSTQPTENYGVDRGHILYKGEINIDPKEVPIKLNAYSRDMTKNNIVNMNSRGLANFGSIMGRNELPVSINDGVHIESGATLVAGIKNNTSNGYNEFVRHFPTLLVDYKDTINRDYRSLSSVNNRLSRLAFVSLNKKDNWFHYRLTTYTDYLDATNNYMERQVQLGTVDQYMERRWIDFSNWLKVSTDVQFSKRKSNYQNNAIEDIDLNLFTTAERAHWNAQTFSSFNRHRDENNKLGYMTTLPLYVSGIVNQDVTWNARTSFRDNHDLNAQGARSSFRSMLGGYRLDTYKRAPFTLSQSFDIESSKTNDSDLLTISAMLETTSTPRYSRNVTLGASYNIKNSLTSSAAATTSDFLEQILKLQGGYAPSNTLRFDASHTTTITLGNFSPLNTTTSGASTQLSQYVNPRNLATTETGSESFHSLTSLSAAWNPKPRLNTQLSIYEDIYKTSAMDISPVTGISAGVSFTNDEWRVNETARFTHGSRENLNDRAYTVSNDTSISYIHSRNLDASIAVSYSTSYSSGDTSHQTNFEQHFNYNFFTKTGSGRKLLEFNETLMYTDGPANPGTDYKKGLLLGLKYYPINRLTLAGGVGYSYSMTNKDYTLIWNASSAVNFSLLQASLDYSYGIRKSDGARESKFTGNIRKSF